MSRAILFPAMKVRRNTEIHFVRSLNYYYTSLIDVMLTVEERPLFQSLQNCLDLRDKYMVMSRQRFSDNPRDHDDVFHGIDEDLVDVMGVRPDANFRGRKKPPATYKPWSIYPPPAPPRWHWKHNNKRFEVNSMVGWDIEPDFEFEKCAIPGDDSRTFELDNFGVFQVYSDVTGMLHSVFDLTVKASWSFYRQITIGGPFSRFQQPRSIIWISISFLTRYLTGQRKVSHSGASNTCKIVLRHTACSMSTTRLWKWRSAFIFPIINVVTNDVDLHIVESFTSVSV